MKFGFQSVYDQARMFVCFFFAFSRCRMTFNVSYKYCILICFFRSVFCLGFLFCFLLYKFTEKGLTHRYISASLLCGSIFLSDFWFIFFLLTFNKSVGFGFSVLNGDAGFCDFLMTTSSEKLILIQEYRAQQF